MSLGRDGQGRTAGLLNAGYRDPVAESLTLTSPLARINGMTPALLRALGALGITSLGKLVAHLPMRHERHEAETAISELQADQIVSARGEIAATRLAGQYRKQRFEAVLMDDTGRLDLVWFNAPYMRDKLKPGERVRVQGKTNRRGPGLQIVNPRLEIIKDDQEPAAREARIRAVYPASEACPSAMIERAMKIALPLALPLIDDHLPPDFRAAHELPELRHAYRAMHAPESEEQVLAARRRLAYDELLLLQLAVHLKRAYLRKFQRAPALKFSDVIDARIRERIPFKLTSSQDSVIADLVKDLTTEVPTNRLIQGDVGSGKTAVALYAMLMAVAGEQQAALLAPTEILAEQHHASISSMLHSSRVRVELLTGATPEQDRASILARLASGEVDILVGTHALLTESVKFHALAVAIIDEQHRFGVAQRATLRAKATRAGDAEVSADPRPLTPHVVVMTATPIPRTMAITLFGDLDISVIRGLPPGRKPVATRAVGKLLRGDVYAEVARRIKDGEQAYVVVPAIDSGGEPGEGDAADLRTVMAELESTLLPGVRIAALHGRLKPSTRDHVMARFRAGAIDVLVATTVIEVGVDVPNATMMIVEDADRFGLAQLHQLRGRVGRGSKPSVCILIADVQTEIGAQRLNVMESTTDGFVLAEKDFELRGPGELFGTRQSGLPPFQVADLSKDLPLLAMARRDAGAWIDRSPALDKPEEALLKSRLLKRYGKDLGLGDVG